MEITPVSDMLTPEGLAAPTLSALVPNESNYTVLLMQPRGQIEASAAGVQNRDRGLASRQCLKFLEDARDTQADLVITPEYSMPWEILVQAIKEGTVPAQGNLWALGCESIRYIQLEALKQDLAQLATVISESLPQDLNRFTDPLAYVFVAPPIEDHGTARIVVLVQFKTCTMGGDVDHFEINGLQLGSLVYQFGGGQDLRLVSLICSDAFAFDEGNHARAVYHQSLIIHVQLNPDPRHTQFRRYRDRLFGYAGDVTEVLCLNWAQDVEEWNQAGKKNWENIAGSAWYLRPDLFDVRDNTLVDNHRRGLYYTWLEQVRTHALFFNYQAAVYHITASKVAHIGVLAPRSYRRGPQLTKTRIWDDAAGSWVEQVEAQDGFSTIAGECGHAEDEIKRIAAANPFAAERVLALSAGKIGYSDDWHRLSQVDSCVIDGSEVIHRITFCQDTNQKALDFRVARLKRLGRLWEILQIDNNLPPSLKDLKGNVRLEWSPGSPHQNVASLQGKRATVIYMGEESAIAQVEATKKRVAEYLHRASSDVDQSLSAQQRLAVWFRDDNDQVELFDAHGYVKIDQTGKASEFDIGREI